MVTLLVKFAKDGVATTGQSRGGRGNRGHAGANRGARGPGHHGGVPRSAARSHTPSHGHGGYPTTGYARGPPQHSYGASPVGAGGDMGRVAYGAHDPSQYYREHAMASGQGDVYGARGYLGGGGSSGRGRRGPMPGRGAYDGDPSTSGPDGSYAVSGGMVSVVAGPRGHVTHSGGERSMGMSGTSTGTASGGSTVSIDTRPPAGGVSMQRLFNPRGVQSPTVSIPVPFLPASSLSSAPAANMYWYNNSAGGMSPAHMSPHNAALAAGAGVPTMVPSPAHGHPDYSMYGGMLYAASPTHLTPRAPVTYLSFDGSPPHVAAGGYSPMAFQYTDAPLSYHQGGPGGLPAMGMGGWQDFSMHAPQQQLVSPAMHQQAAPQQQYAPEHVEPRRTPSSHEQ